MAIENGEPRCCAHCGGELGEDGFAARIPEEAPAEESLSPETFSDDIDSAFTAALRRRKSGEATEGA